MIGVALDILLLLCILLKGRYADRFYFFPFCLFLISTSSFMLKPALTGLVSRTWAARFRWFIVETRLSFLASESDFLKGSLIFAAITTLCVWLEKENTKDALSHNKITFAY